MKQLTSILFIVLGYVALYAQVSVTASFDSTRMLIGDQTDLHLVVKQKSDIGIVFPVLSKQQLDGMEIIEMSDIDTLRRTPELVLQQNITVAAFDSGFYRIPPLPFEIKRGNQITDTAYSRMVMMTVSTLQVDTNYVAPIKPIIEQALTFQDLLPYLIGLIGMFMLGFGLYMVNQRNKNVVIEQPEIIIPPHEIAFGKFRVLKDKKLWQQSKLKEYHSQLTFIIREYIENRFEVPALESTTEEVVQALKGKDFDREQKDKLREILQSADLVKFAKAAPPPDVHEKAMEVAIDFVRKTKKEIVLSEPDQQAGNE